MRGHVRALVRRDMSRRGKRCHAIALHANCPHRPSQNEYRKRVFQSGMRPSSLPSSLRYGAASCFDAARSADLECADMSALWSDATCRVEESDVMPSHSTPNAPIVHPKMNSGKESSRAECARLRSRLHCVTPRRAASTRQGVRIWSARTRPRFGPTRHVASRKAMSCHRTPCQLP